MEINGGGQDPTVDEAMEIVGRHRDRKNHSGEVPVVATAERSTWLRVVLLVLSVAFLINSIAVATLAVVNASSLNESRQDQELRLCREAYTSRIAEAAAATRLAEARGRVLFNEGLVALVQTGDAASVVNVEDLVASNREIEEATRADVAANEERAAWEAAGSRLPCPIHEGD